MLTSFRAGSFPAAYCTITSVPPAMGSHLPGSCARSDSTAGKVAGSDQFVIGGIGSHVEAPCACGLRRRPRKFARSRCSGKDCRERPSRISSSVGCGVLFSRWRDARIIPGVQMPHWAPPQSRKDCCNNCEQPSVGKAFDRDDGRAVRLKRGNRQLFTNSVDQDRAGAALALSAAFFRSC